VVDQDRSASSRGLVQRLVASGYFVVEGSSASMDLADEALLGRRVSVIVRIPADFGRQLVRSGAAPVQLVLNAEDGAQPVIHSPTHPDPLQLRRRAGAELQTGVRTKSARASKRARGG
jgi:hypothetical protein